MKLLWLTTEADFAAFRVSKQFSSPVCRIRVRSTQNQNVARFGFIIPKKILPKVVDRNKVKRRLKAVLVQITPRLKPSEVLVFPSARILKLKFSELETEFVTLLTKAQVCKS